MNSKNTVAEPFTSADKQRLLDRIAELELENSYLKAENAGLKTEIASLQDEVSKTESEPEFSEAFDESAKIINNLQKG